MEIETLEMLINELESQVLKAKRSMLSSGDVIINRPVVLDLVSRIRESYPLVVKQAVQITKDCDEMIKKAEAYANETMDKAEEQARLLVAQSEISRQAKQAAQDMHDEAAEYYQKMDYDAREFAFKMLSDVEKTMRGALAEINDKKRKLIEE